MESAGAEAKIRLHLRAVAQAPALKQNKFTIDSSQPFGEVDWLLQWSRLLQWWTGNKRTADGLACDVLFCFDAD